MVWRKSNYFLAACLMFVAIAYGSMHFVTAVLSRYHQEIAITASKVIGQPVSIAKIKTGWHGLVPVLQLRGVDILNPDNQPVLHIRRLEFGLKLFKSLRHWRVEPGRIVVDGAEIHWRADTQPGAFAQLLPWLMSQKKLVFKHMTLHSHGDWPFKLDNLNLTIKQYQQQREITATADLSLNNNTTPINFMATFAKAAWDGRFYLHAPALPLKTLQNYLPVQDKAINTEFWGEIKHSKLQQVQSKFNFASGQPVNGVWARVPNGRYQLHIPSVDLAQLQAYLEPKLALAGQVQGLNLLFDKQQIYAVHADIRDAGVFGLQGVSAQAQLLDGERIGLMIPDQSVRALPFKNPINIQGQIDGLYQHGQFKLIVPGVRLSSPAWSVFIDSRTHAKFSVTDIQALKDNWLPQALLPKDFATWFRQTEIKSSALSGEIEWAEGLKITSSAKIPYFVYKQGWPAAENIQADMTYQKQKFNFKIYQATLLKQTINNIQISVADKTLSIKGSAKATTAAIYQYLNQSKLINLMPALNALSFTDQVGLKLDIQLPLTKLKNTTIKGQVDFLGNHLKIPEWQLNLTDLQGHVQFDEHGVRTGRLKHQFWDTPWVTELSGEAHEPLKINFTGPLKLQTPIIQGQTPVQGALILSLNHQNKHQLTLASDLVGLALNLPAPYDKQASTKQSLYINTEFTRTGPMAIKFRLADVLTGALEARMGPEKITVNRGKFLLGGQLPPSLPTEAKLGIQGEAKPLKLATWVDFLRGPSRLPIEIPKEITADIKLSVVDIYGQVLQNSRLMVRNHLGKWEIGFKHPQITGEIKLPQDFDEPIYADFTEVHLPALTTEQHLLPFKKPGELPPLIVKVKQLSLGERQFGQINLRTQPHENDLVIQNLKITHPAYRVETSGVWDNEKTKLHGYIITNKLAHALESWNIPPVIDSQQGELTFDLNWPTSPLKISAADMNGTLMLKLKQGRITQLSNNTEKKIGLGKLLSILSLQTIPRRVNLDFSDLSKSGYSFDKIEGHFTAVRGKLSTDNLQVTGPVASAKIQGDLDLHEHEYNLRLRVSPHVTASLPVVATLAGGPVAGAVAWVANKVISRGVQKVVAYTYEISGPWDNPEVKQLKIRTRRA